MWSIWGTNVWKCFPIRTEGGGICKLLLPHGSSSLPILIVMRPARASSAAGRCHGPAGHAVCQLGQRGAARLGSARQGTARQGTARHSIPPPPRTARPRTARPGSARLGATPPALAGRRGSAALCVCPLLLGAEPIKIRTFLLKGITITIEPLSSKSMASFPYKCLLMPLCSPSVCS